MAHNLFSIGLIIYCFACYAFVFCLVRTPCEDGEVLWLTCKTHCSEHPIRGWLLLALAFVFLAPLIVPYAIVSCIWKCGEELKKYRKLRRTHRPFAFIWLNPSKLPAAPRKYIDEQCHEMRDEGFIAVGTYIMKTILPDYYGRVFIHNAGTTTSSICYLKGDTFFSFTTVFESGRVLETTPTSPSKAMQHFVDNPRMTAHYATGESIEVAHYRHLEKIAEIFDETGDRPLAFTADQACEVLEYEGCVFSGELFALGRLDAEPPKPVLPTGVPVMPEPVLS